MVLRCFPDRQASLLPTASRVMPFQFRLASEPDWVAQSFDKIVAGYLRQRARQEARMPPYWRVYSKARETGRLMFSIKGQLMFMPARPVSLSLEEAREVESVCSAFNRRSWEDEEDYLG